MTKTYDDKKTVILISTGKELLRGITLASNGHFLAKRLTKLGCEVTRIVIIDDDARSIGAEILDALKRKPDYIITTGGLGPTFDDMTVTSISKALKRKLAFHPEALRHVTEFYKLMHERGVVRAARLNPMRKKMAYFPVGATPLTNPCGGAPGVRIEASSSVIFCLPGVPPEMKGVFRVAVWPELQHARRKETRVDVRTHIQDESELSPLIDRLMKKYPGIYIKSRVHGSNETMRIVLSLHGSPAHHVHAAAKTMEQYARGRG